MGIGQRFLDKMREAADDADGDTEAAHVNMDMLLVDTIRQLFVTHCAHAEMQLFVTGLGIYEKAKKWYA